MQPGWRVNDILLAARVLQTVPDRPAYSDEAEMRRVFGLVYDVFRCKLLIIVNRVFGSLLIKFAPRVRTPVNEHEPVNVHSL